MLKLSKKTAWQVACVCMTTMLAIAFLLSAAGLTTTTAAYAETRTQTTTSQSPGAYTIEVSPSYANPITGVIEDRGQNAAIGQGMTASVIDAIGLLEIYENGDSFITVRSNLLDNISNIQFAYQDGANLANADFVPTPYTVTQVFDDGITADLRFSIPDLDDLVRISMFVTPMGRDIVFFITLANPTTGSADFIVTPTAAADSNPTSNTVEISDQSTAMSAPSEPSADSGNELAMYTVLTIAVVTVITLIGFFVYKQNKRKVASDTFDTP